ncbi:hypothetical protein V2J09_019449 [Rumex salicifolius]
MDSYGSPLFRSHKRKKEEERRNRRWKERERERERWRLRDSRGITASNSLARNRGCRFGQLLELIVTDGFLEKRKFGWNYSHTHRVGVVSMELPQPSRPYATEGRKTTHDFLSLYSHSPVQQDPRPSSHGGHLKTHNFLQPLEKEDNKKKSARENSSVELNVDKPPPTAQPCTREHVLHGGIGTYSISHISSFNPRMPKPEGSSFTVAPPRASSNERNDDNSSSSYTAGSSFTLWEEPSSSRKGKTGKENLGELNTTKEQVVRAGQLQMDRPSDSSSNHHNSFSTRSSSQPPAQKNQSFMEMLHSTEGISAKEEDEDESEFTLRKEITSRTGDLNVKVDGKGNNDQKANTPRSKHSATEQRRRCKINDRQV